MTKNKPTKKTIKKKAANGKPRKKPAVEKAFIMRSLDCKLPDKSRLAAAVDLAAAMDEIDQLDSKRKQANDEFKGAIEEQHAIIEDKRRVVNRGTEVRQVECEKNMNYRTATVKVTRLDTKEVVEERKMTPAETQRNLDLKTDPPDLKILDGVGDREESAETPPDDVTEKDTKEAMRHILELHRASTGTLQRKMSIGYTKAARIMDKLEEVGFVGPPKGSEARDILFDTSQVEEWADSPPPPPSSDGTPVEDATPENQE